MALPNIKQWLRYTSAVVFSFLFGNILAMPFGLIIDVIVGREVTGMDWHLNMPNIIYNAIIGFFTGLCAARISKYHGVLIAIIAQFFPLLAFTIFEIAINRDITSTFAVKPSIWIYAGMLPAIAGGYLGMKMKKNLLPAIGVFILSLLMFANIIGGIALHLFTVYISYQSAGIIVAFLTFSAPFVSEIVWWLISWHQSGHFINGYSQWCLLLVITAALQMTIMFIVSYYEDKGQKQTFSNNVKNSTASIESDSDLSPQNHLSSTDWK